MKEFLLGLYNIITSFIMWIPIFWIRRTYLRLFLGKIGDNVFIARNVDIRKPKNIFIGDNTVINKRVLLDGRGGRLIIDDNVDIAQDAFIWTLTHDINDNNHKAIGRNVTIHSHVWIGARATIMPGIQIGEGAVVGTMAVVTKDILPHNIVVGIPARVTGTRKNTLKYTFHYHPWFS